MYEGTENISVALMFAYAIAGGISIGLGLSDMYSTGVSAVIEKPETTIVAESLETAQSLAPENRCAPLDRSRKPLCAGKCPQP